MKKTVIVASLTGILQFSCGTPTTSDLSAPPPHSTIVTFDQLNLLSKPVQVSYQHQGQTHYLDMVELPIPLTRTVTERSLDYLSHIFPEFDVHELTRHLWMDPKMVVLHSMALGDLKTALEASGFLADGMTWGSGGYGNAPVGAHFMIDTDGTIYVITPPRKHPGLESAFQYENLSQATFFTRKHVGYVNPWAIGIENIVPAHPAVFEIEDDQKKFEIFGDLTPAQVAANAQLIGWLMSEIPGLQHVFSHHQFDSQSFYQDLKDTFALPITPPEGGSRHRWDVGQETHHKIMDELVRLGFHQVRFDLNQHDSKQLAEK